ncbi:MAG: hypothetical protein E7631_07675, partial [Ruminococcaceae bacterium]|nr:hypothetical protein [Oscillospiraceae bacterium]
MKLRSTLCLLLTLLVLAPSMASCGNAENETTADTSADNTAVQTETEPVDPWLDDLPDSMDLGGRTINILSRVEGEEMNEFVVEEMTGDVINDAIFTRNLNLEARLNVKIANTPVWGDDASGTKELENVVVAGSTDYDIFCSNSYRTAESGYKGHLLDLNSLQ